MISCKEHAERVKQEVKNAIAEMGTKPTLTVVSVGDDAASQAYAKGKVKDCNEVGIAVHHVQLPAETPQHMLMLDMISCPSDGIILQMPLPKHLNTEETISYIYRSQDVDGLQKNSIYTPCTALGIYNWLNENVELSGKHVVVINRSKIIGKPLAKMLLDADATVTVCHSKTRYLESIVCSADIIVTAVGMPNFLQGCWLKPDAIIVDAGINRVDGKIVGDCAPDCAEQVAYVTPVPGGVGLLTRAYLLKNVLEAHKKGV